MGVYGRSVLLRLSFPTDRHFLTLYKLKSDFTVRLVGRVCSPMLRQEVVWWLYELRSC
jgi:hypothetical protein